MFEPIGVWYTLCMMKFEQQPIGSTPEEVKKRINEASDKYVSIILKHQDNDGPFPATGEKEYKYSPFRWVRDSLNTALGLIYKLENTPEEESGELTQAIEKNFEWWFGTIKNEEEMLKDLISADQVSVDEFYEKALPARFTKEGEREEKSELADKNWPNVQLDGYGTLLAVFEKYVKQTGKTDFAEHYKDGVSLITSYLSKFATYPNYDMWEDSQFWGDNGCLHSSTLACIYSGLSAVDKMNIDGIDDQKDNLSSIKSFVEKNFKNSKGELVKYIQRKDDGTYSIPEDKMNHIDSSMILLSSPFSDSMYSPEDPLMKNISERVERDLNKDGGVKRYPGDQFYDGGRWPMLSALHGIHLLREGDIKGALRNAEWILNVQDENFNLIEQVTDNPNSQIYLDWCEKWGGKPTTPLLMGHGFAIVFFEELKKGLSK